MPVIHIHGGQKKISAINNNSVLEPGTKPFNAAGISVCTDTYYVFKYWFWEKPILFINLILVLLGITEVIMGWSRSGRWEEEILGFICLGLGYWLWKYPFTYEFKKFVVFDQKTGIVYIPKRIGKKYDRILFKDASFIMVDRYSNIYGTNRNTYFYLLRPGWDLIRDGWIKNTYSLIELSADPNESTQETWAFLVDFMAGRRKSYYTLKAAQNGRPNFAKFDPSKLGTDLTWTRDENGKWHKVKPIK